MSSYVACIYASVKGRLDKLDPSKITQARKELREHVKFTQQPRLANLHIKGIITEETGAKTIRKTGPSRVGRIEWAESSSGLSRDVLALKGQGPVSGSRHY